MAKTNHDIARAFELRLLRCSYPPPTSKTPPPPSATPNHQSLPLLIEGILSSIEKGDYYAALSSDAVRLVFPFAESRVFDDDSIEGADRFYGEAESSASSFLQDNASDAWLSVLETEEDDAERSLRAVLVMCIGVAAFLAFTQCNVTGPVEKFSPFPLRFRGLEGDKAVSRSEQWDMWARKQLMASGSDVLGKFSLLQYIVYAKMLLIKMKDLSMEGSYSCLSGTRSISWWLLRLTSLQQRILDERLSSLYDPLRVWMSETLHHFGNLDTIANYWVENLHEGEASIILSMAYLEAGIAELTYGRVDSSRTFFSHAEEACRLRLSLSGVLGFRRVHQEEARAQMVLVAETDEHKSGDPNNMESATLNRCSFAFAADKMVSHSVEQHPNCDILMTPKLVENGKSAGTDQSTIHTGNAPKMPLNGIEQAIILAQGLLLKNMNVDDELQGWHMAPYIEAIDAQQLSYYIIRCFCDILRIRWESTRSGTKQRALLMFDNLVQEIYEAFPGAVQRIYFAYGTYVPTIPALRKEYGELLVSCGMIGEALKIFEDLELWDNLIDCYCLLGKKAAADDLIRARLRHMPNDPRLWCSLGDVTNDDSFYSKALEISNNKSARAKRSLARSAYNRGDYEKSKNLWESALAINPLFPDGWFALGAAALKDRDIDKALAGFTHAVQLDPDNGEAWNNIACLQMIKKKSKEAFIAFKEALKFRRTSWQMWENFSQVAMDIGNVSQALEAIKMVLDMTNNKRVDSELLEKLVVEMEARCSATTIIPSTVVEDPNSVCHRSPGNSLSDSVDVSGNFDSQMAESRKTEQLMNLLGKVLQQIVRSGKGENIWGLYARWHKVKGDLTMCSEALLKQVRSYQGSDLWHNQDRFKRFAYASLQLCKVYMEVASSTGSHRELTAAEMHLRNTVKQAVRFSDTEEFKHLQACLDEVKMRLEATSAGNS